MGFDGKMEITTLEGVTQHVSQGPAAAIIPIKQLGTNGGGYYGVNSSHPLENPTYLSNMVESADGHGICLWLLCEAQETGIQYLLCHAGRIPHRGMC